MPRKKLNRTAAQWQELINTFEESGLTVTEFCRQHQLAVSVFYQWRKRLSDKPASEALSSDDNWQPVNLPNVEPVTQSDWDIELSLPNGVTLRMRQ